MHACTWAHARTCALAHARTHTHIGDQGYFIIIKKYKKCLKSFHAEITFQCPASGWRLLWTLWFLFGDFLFSQICDLGVRPRASCRMPVFNWETLGRHTGLLDDEKTRHCHVRQVIGQTHLFHLKYFVLGPLWPEHKTSVTSREMAAAASRDFRTT